MTELWMTLDVLIDQLEEMPEVVEVDTGSGYRRLEYISRAIMQNNVLKSATGMVIIQFDPFDSAILPKDTVVNVRFNS